MSATALPAERSCHTRSCERRLASHVDGERRASQFLGTRLAPISAVTVQRHAKLLLLVAPLLLGANSATSRGAEHGARQIASALPEAAALFNAAALPECISVRAQARPGTSGYNHWVFIANRCDAPAACDVSTNVNPSTMTVAVQPGTTQDVLTFRESPARTFTPFVSCKLAAPD